MDYKYWRELRHKENKTEEEKLLLEARKTLSIICNLGVSLDKLEISKDGYIEEVRELVGNIINDL